ncbi:MAG: helix-turn-helix transcriptional regulator [Hoeflea sp.]|uniref:helix-turn-helix domain-containing protein n=1 Tax=Hoeflea sp. TaxID=1940281 RepID=UPI001DB9DCB5|nr:helix-turn-helix transcriptional regulator [Hoeflea sp.]MBU4529093.1 helix-turn-helix transcriptional regulator [Alphaproteobacteria bacterium]MBU4543498.1 helix-turn-helix transcriptional regulator [Alphaproteobacteria bacterium]MBU4549123.1 helix-turn-helix transcriptional regulator [Alphaproteobacteria bacterium]MBV1725258.1 helix-turn-helix transcriptional regulator [Hoeflea sp.]MBV1785219.1 helix-turn-helix transcriptional regulator [Hoeflea sp.]
MTGLDSREQDMQAMRQRVYQCVSQFDIFRLLREITEQFGFKFFLVANTSGSASGAFSEAVVITSAPSDLIQGYEDNGLMAANPLAAMIREAGAPSEHRPRASGSPQADCEKTVAIATMTENDLDCWFTVPVYDPDHGAAAVCFLGNRPPMSACETAEMTLYAHLMHQKLRQVSAKPAKSASPLTDRERECLLWTAAGKTSVEIGRILDLSEHTVNHYLNNVARKVGAVNRTQAVAYAMRHGYIE